MARGKQTQSQHHTLGFTIVEVMIVLAVTGLMFVSVALVISGKQQTAQFQTSLNTMVSQIQQVSNEVASGYFPHDGYQCSISGGAINIRSGSAPSTGQCNFIGKAVHFYSSDADNNHFSVYSIAGIENDTATYEAAKPFLIAKTNAYTAQFTAADNVTANVALGYGLHVPVNGMKFVPKTGSPVNIGSFAFMQSLNQNVAGGDGGGTSQHMVIMALPSSGSTLSNNQVLEADKLDTAFKRTPIIYATDGSVTVCFDSGATQQSGTIKIGSGSSDIDVTATISGSPCP